MDASANAAREPSIMQASLAEIRGLTGLAEIILERVLGQRSRLLGDVPPSAPTPGPKPGIPERAVDASVSFMDLGEAFQRLRSRLGDIDGHTAALGKIG